MATPRPPKVVLSERERVDLDRLVSAYTTGPQLALRARIVLLAGDAWNNLQIARELRVDDETPGHWRRRWLQFLDIPLEELSVAQATGVSHRRGHLAAKMGAKEKHACDAAGPFCLWSRRPASSLHDCMTSKTGARCNMSLGRARGLRGAVCLARESGHFEQACGRFVTDSPHFESHLVTASASVDESVYGPAPKSGQSILRRSPCRRWRRKAGLD
jgi:hypothetical protein